MTDQQHGSLLAVEAVSKQFAGLRAVDDVSFEVAQGAITALVGPNGAGKTSLFNLVTGFLKADCGEVRYNGARISGKSPHWIARHGLVRTFQLRKTLGAMTVVENLMVAAPNQPGERLHNLILRRRASSQHERDVRSRAFELLESFDLAHKANVYAGTLSGGQRKLLELARALMVEPKLILLDEPMAGVNRTVGIQLLNHVHRLRSASGVTFLLIEHDMDVVMNNADRVIVMANGRVVADGMPQKIRHNERLLDVYLGSRRDRRDRR